MDSKQKKLRVGIMGASAFALRAMGPGLTGVEGMELAAVASRDPEKAASAAQKLGCRAVDGYEGLLADAKIDAIYMPLPTGLHREWGMAVLRAGKHLLVEKSLAGNLGDARLLVAEARRQGVALLENFLFPRHSQTAWVQENLSAGKIGRLRFFKAAFTIPSLDDGNFRYCRDAGGGALLDTGAYMVKSVSVFLGGGAELLGASMQECPRRGVDVGGSAGYLSASGVAAQLEWGFDCAYQCSWEFVGDAGRIFCGRALTPPPGFPPPVCIHQGSREEDIELTPDDHYSKQWGYFSRLACDAPMREAEYQVSLKQAEGLEEIARKAKRTTI